MLDMFKVSRTFYKLHVSLIWDRADPKASVTITYDRLIVRMGDIPSSAVNTPEKAEAWMHEQTPVLGDDGKTMGTMSRIEAWERACKLGHFST